MTGSFALVRAERKAKKPFFSIPPIPFLKRRAQHVILSERAERARVKDLLLRVLVHLPMCSYNVEIADVLSESPQAENI